MLNRNYQLPDGWTTERIGDICFVTKLAGFEFTKYVKYVEVGEIPVIRAQNVTKHGFREGNFIYVKRDVFESLTRSKLQGGEILMAFVGSVGNVGIVPIGKEYFLGPNVALIRVDEKRIFNKYLYYYLSSDSGKSGVLKFSKSTTQSSISMGNIRDVVFPLPPLPDQKRIVAKIEELFTQLEVGMSALAKVQAGLRLYEASVLKAAVEGKLVAQDSRDEPAEKLLHQLGKNPLDNVDLAVLPNNWCWVTPDDLADDEHGSISAGPFGTIFKARDFRPTGVPIIFLRHVLPGTYFPDKKPTFMDQSKWDELFRSYSVYGGELLVTKLGEPPGACAIYPTGIGQAMVTPDVIKMKVNEELALPKYLMHFFNSENARKYAFGVAFGTTRLRMTLPIFRHIPVPLPPLEEQRRIVAEVERRLSVAREVENAVEGALVRASRLRQAVLKSAFEGRLVNGL